MNPQRPLHRAASRGFTLLEILIAITILGLLVGLLVTNIGSTLESGREDIASTYVKSGLSTSLQRYQLDNGRYPAALKDLKSNPGTARNWRGPYVAETLEWPPIDPWGEPYQYKAPGEKTSGYDLWSKGKDLQSGTEDDIGNWAKPTTNAEE